MSAAAIHKQKSKLPNKPRSLVATLGNLSISEKKEAVNVIPDSVTSDASEKNVNPTANLTELSEAEEKIITAMPPSILLQRITRFFPHTAGFIRYDEGKMMFIDHKGREAPPKQLASFYYHPALFNDDEVSILQRRHFISFFLNLTLSFFFLLCISVVQRSH